MKKLLAVLLTLSLLTGVLTGCGGTAPEQTPVRFSNASTLIPH